LILLGCAQQEIALPSPGEEVELIYKCECRDAELIYRCQRFWTEEEFSNITEDNLATLFNQTYTVDAKDFNFTFNETNYSTITRCHVYGQISRSGDGYLADFHWFLNSLSLDFLDDNFEESTTGLSWQGSLDSVPTSIRIECPKQDLVYKAWQHPVGHCHAHIWWPASSGNMVK
jgi:hypothetical protein